MSPPGTLIARWYCPQGHCTFSLLPDHLAARFPGTLSEIEQVVATVERAPSVEAAADALRPDAITLASALRWVRRRLAPVRKALTILVGMFPERLLGCAPRVAALRERLGCDAVLVELRALCALHLQALSRPLGFGYRRAAGVEHEIGFQHRRGPDPPVHIR